MKIVSIISLLFLLTTSIGCGNEDSVLSPQITNLAGTWRLIEPKSLYKITLEATFDTANPPVDITPFLISGESSVNEYSARLFATVDGTMQINAVGSTKMAGPPEAMQFEQIYLAKLKTVVRYELTATNQLRMYHGGTQPGVLVYEKLN